MSKRLELKNALGVNDSEKAIEIIKSMYKDGFTIIREYDYEAPFYLVVLSCNRSVMQAFITHGQIDANKINSISPEEQGNLLHKAIKTKI